MESLDLNGSINVYTSESQLKLKLAETSLIWNSVELCAEFHDDYTNAKGVINQHEVLV